MKPLSENKIPVLQIVNIAKTEEKKENKQSRYETKLDRMDDCVVIDEE
jgi:hypothetical protein